jgi:hypothetical protein
MKVCAVLQEGLECYVCIPVQEAPRADGPLHTETLPHLAVRAVSRQRTVVMHCDVAVRAVQALLLPPPPRVRASLMAAQPHNAVAGLRVLPSPGATNSASTALRAALRAHL